MEAGQNNAFLSGQPVAHIGYRGIGIVLCHCVLTCFLEFLRTSFSDLLMTAKAKLPNSRPIRKRLSITEAMHA